MERGSGRVGEGPGGSLRVWEVIFIGRTWTCQGVSVRVNEGLGGSEISISRSSQAVGFGT